MTNSVEDNSSVSRKRIYLAREVKKVKREESGRVELRKCEEEEKTRREEAERKHAEHEREEMKKEIQRLKKENEQLKKEREEWWEEREEMMREWQKEREVAEEMDEFISWLRSRVGMKN